MSDDYRKAKRAADHVGSDAGWLQHLTWEEYVQLYWAALKASGISVQHLHAGEHSAVSEDFALVADRLVRERNGTAIRLHKRALVWEACGLKPRACYSRRKNPDCNCLAEAIDEITGDEIPDPEAIRRDAEG